jgi:5-(hydroxymethyl)furfural/furfural oxidase
MEHDAMAQLAQTNPIATHLIVGGGAAGCVLANRLSADPDNRVILLEAGADTLPEATPADILATYPGRAMANMDYFWPKLQARRGEGEYIPEAGPGAGLLPSNAGDGRGIEHQRADCAARQPAQRNLRGLPRDFESWERAGARSWNWEAVLPYFRGLEQDVDFDNAMHGCQGPVPIRRVPPTQWDHFTQAVGEVWSQGHAFIDAMNGQFGDGYATRHPDDTRALLLVAPGWVRTELGGDDASLSTGESIPLVVDTIDANRGKPGLRYLNRFNKSLPC